jgi:parvulin-like peptidyl-prolyl isomerase
MKRFLFVSIFLVISAVFSYASDVLAVVNGENITTEVAPKDFKTLDKKTQKLIVKRLIEKRLASDYALKSDVVKTDEFKKVLKHVFQMSEKSNKSSDALANLLKKDASIEGYTKEQLYSKKGLLAFDFILNQKAEEFAKNEKEIKKYYQNNKYKYDTPAMIELLSIVVNDKKTADKIYNQLKNSKNSIKDFEELAKKYSLAPSKDDGGYFGKLPVASLNDIIKPFLKDLKRGDFTKPIKTEFGYQIFYVLNQIPEFKSTYSTVKSQVTDDYVRQEVKNWAMDKIKELKNSAKIEVKI